MLVCCLWLCLSLNGKMCNLFAFGAFRGGGGGGDLGGAGYS